MIWFKPYGIVWKVNSTKVDGEFLSIARQRLLDTQGHESWTSDIDASHGRSSFMQATRFLDILFVHVTKRHPRMTPSRRGFLLIIVRTCWVRKRCPLCHVPQPIASYYSRNVQCDRIWHKHPFSSATKALRSQSFSIS